MDNIQGLSCRILKERSLKKWVPSRIISAANTEVAFLQQAGGAKVSTRGTYLKMSSEKKAENIGKRAAEHGVLAIVRYYTSRLPEPLKESSVCTVNVSVACLGQ